VREVRRAHLVAAIGKPCTYCGDPMAAPTRDHIRPRSKGGTLAPGNKTLACDRCNTDKGDRSLASWLYRLEMAGDSRAVIVRALVLACAGADRSDSETKRRFTMRS
jgi:HNH endonuclease